GDGQFLDLPSALAAWRARYDPFAKHSVLPGVFCEPRSALVQRLAGGFQEQQASIGVNRVNAPAERVAGECRVVFFGVVTKQREAETVLSLEGSVARTSVAAHLAEQAHDVPFEINGFDGSAARQFNRTGRRRSNITN